MRLIVFEFVMIKSMQPINQDWPVKIPAQVKIQLNTVHSFLLFHTLSLYCVGHFNRKANIILFSMQHNVVYFLLSYLLSSIRYSLPEKVPPHTRSRKGLRWVGCVRDTFTKNKKNQVIPALCISTVILAFALNIYLKLTCSLYFRDDWKCLMLTGFPLSHRVLKTSDPQ